MRWRREMRWFHPCLLRSLAESSGEIQEKSVSRYVQGRPALGVAGFTRLIQACTDSGTLQAGKSLEDEIRSRGLQRNKSLGNHLINMYGRFSSADDAKRSFDSIEKKNSVSYNAMIGVLAQNGRCREAVSLFQRLLLENSKLANDVTFVSTLKSCGSDLGLGKWLHGLVESSGLAKDLIVGTALINMYASCGIFDLAKKVFDRMEERNEISWTALIAAHAAVGESSTLAWRIFLEMEQGGILPNEVTVITLLSACTQPEDLHVGRLVHAAAEELGHAQEAVVSNSLVNMYGKCGELEEARRLLDEAAQKHSSPVAWNSLLGAYTQHRSFFQAIQLFHLMQLEGVKTNRMTFLAALNACAGLAEWTTGKKLSSWVVECGLHEDDLVKTALVSLYGKCGYLDVACELLARVSAPDVVSWSSIVAAFASQHGRERDVLKAFHQLLKDGLQPDDVMLSAALHACGALKALQYGRWIHTLVKDTGVESEDVLAALVSMYGKCGEILEARKVFDALSSSCECSDGPSWNAIIGSYAQSEQPLEALKLFRDMLLKGKRPRAPVYVSVLHAAAAIGSLSTGCRIHEQMMEIGLPLDMILLTSLVAVYARCGRLETAWEIFESMEFRSIVSWNTMLGACPEDEQDTLFSRLLSEGLRPDRVTFLSLLSSCSDLRRGIRLHSFVSEKRHLESDVGLFSALVHMYSRCGSLDSSVRTFERMHFCGDLVTWNSVVGACAQHGHAGEALFLARSMEQEGVSPDKVTWTAILSACSHGGLVEEAYSYFHRLLLGEYGVQVRSEHLSSMVDLLCRTGKLAEAEELINRIAAQADSVTWTCFLAGCRTYGDVIRGEFAAARLMELSPHDPGAYVTLSNAYR